MADEPEDRLTASSSRPDIAANGGTASASGRSGAPKPGDGSGIAVDAAADTASPFDTLPGAIDTLLLTALDAAGELILVRGNGGRVMYVNAAFLRAFGGAREDWVGRWFSVAPPVSAQDSRRYEMLMRTRKGAIWIEWDERLLPDGAGVISVGRDVTSRRAAHDDLQASQRAKSLFFAAVTHELRTPLAGALGVSRLLEATPLKPDQADYVRSIAASADHALSMVDDILDLSRLEAGRLELRPETVDVADLVRETVELAAPRAQEKGLEIGVVHAAGAPSRITGDAARLKQILYNLLGNAVKFTQAGGVRLDIANAPDSEGRDRLALSVSDTGPGISEADQESLFEHFERGAAERNGAESGAGLGLAMVRRLADAMNSAMGVESRLGEGAKFWLIFDLPVLATRTDRPLSGRHVFVASANDTLRESLCDQLEALGAEATAIMSAADLAKAEGRELLCDAAWADDAGSARVWQLVTPVEKAQRTDLVAESDANWFVKPVRAATLVAQLTSGQAVDGSTVVPQGQLAPGARFQPDLSGLHLLVAEDDPVNALIARKCLEGLGVRVTPVARGDAALESLTSQAFDAALLDQRMPGLDGPDVARAAREAGFRLPLIALTANDSEADRKLCLGAGMDEFLTKPLDADQLADILTRLCRPGNRASMG
ncbi:hybrid sensor histidine kinase/response regulator [Maricaulis maris]|uniref:histidine kinase n=1 Tax=Maricaulis maris TaxID=74318 RepID=A0A495D4E3_9PROT|nr:ATP-binding protein [Maricaulis maris]RKQ96787.1 signal transduction histidine kinase [Maricaulis maris]